MNDQQKRVLSGMQPSGRLHLGNYLGALENWKKLQAQYESFFFVADWHALSTNYQETDQVRDHVHDLLVNWLAAGIDPQVSTLFIQSRVPEHAVLHLLLSMIVPVPWLERNPTYKEQIQALSDHDLSTYGFLGYPVLQAADILIYKAHYVPVGQDQLPHMELTREIARRFNHLYVSQKNVSQKTSAKSPRMVFPEPEGLLTNVPKLPGTDGRKMSKSYNNAIYLSDPEPVFREKVKTMITDPARKRRHDPGNPDVCPVFDYHKIYSSTEMKEQVNRECRSAKIGCIDCKKNVTDSMVEEMRPIWARRQDFLEKPDLIQDIISDGSRRAQQTARATLGEVQEAMKI